MRFKGQLKALARRSRHKHYQHAAILAYNNRVLGRGINSEYWHAEIAAIDDACDHPAPLRGCVLYTLVIKRATGALGNGSPCPACMAALMRAGIKKVVVYI